MNKYRYPYSIYLKQHGDCTSYIICHNIAGTAKGLYHMKSKNSIHLSVYLMMLPILFVIEL
jgi:hypothetical protein